MLKLKFSGTEGTIYLYFARAFIHNYDDSTSTFSTTKNTGVTLYENPKPIWDQIEFPSYLDFSSDSDYVERTYYYEHNTDLKIILTFKRLGSSTVDKYGTAGVSCTTSLRYGSQNYTYSVATNLIEPTDCYPLNFNVGGANYGVFAYDIVNNRIMALQTPTFIVTKENTYSNKKYYSGAREPFPKGYYPYEVPSFPSTLNIGDVVKQLVPLSHETKFGTMPLFLDLLSDDDKKGYPDGDDDPEFPDPDKDDDSDDVDPDPIFPTAATGFVSLYAPTQAQLKSLASYMWSNDFVDLFVKLIENPYESIISIKNVCSDFSTGGSTNIILGNVDTGIQANEITQPYQQIDCGTINLTRYFGNFLDFNPYTSIKIYLPFIGFRELDVDEVMGASLHLYYNIDLLTGSCVALINVTKSISGTNLNSVLYQYDGMIATEIPVTGADYSQVVSAIIKGVASVGASIGITAATGGTGAAGGATLLRGALSSEASTAIGTAVAVNSAVDMVSSKINVQHGGSLGGSMGALATKQPYVIIHRVIPKNPTNYAKLHGIPSNAYKTLSSLKGFTKMQDIQIKSTIGSVDETEEIKQLLLEGVVI